MRAWLRVVVATALATLLALAGLGTAEAVRVSGAGATAQCAPGVRVGPGVNAFYNPPSPLPKGPHGDLVWARRVDAPRHARACRISRHLRRSGDWLRAATLQGWRRHRCPGSAG